VLDTVTTVRAEIVCLMYVVTVLRAERSRNCGSIPGSDKLFISSPKVLTSVFETTQPPIKWIPVALSPSGTGRELTAYLCKC
jgi:hypothetical protein